MTIKEFYRSSLKPLIYDADFECGSTKLVPIQNNCLCVASHITYYSLIFKDCSDNKYYKASYSFNKHSYEELCFDDVDEYGQVKCIEVKPVEITRIEYQTA